MTTMTTTFDRFFVSRGVEARDLTAMKGRAFFYAAFTAMGGTGIALIAGILSNLAA